LFPQIDQNVTQKHSGVGKLYGGGKVCVCYQVNFLFKNTGSCTIIQVIRCHNFTK